MKFAQLLFVVACICGCGADAHVQRASRPSPSQASGSQTSAESPPILQAASQPTSAHFERIFRELRDGISDEGLFAPALTLHTISASGSTDSHEGHEEARGWDLVIALIERTQYGYRDACRQQEPPSDCRWNAGIDYLGEPKCNERCCEAPAPHRRSIPHLKRVCFDGQLRANALTISELR